MKITDIINEYDNSKPDLTILQKSIIDEFHRLLFKREFYKLDELKYYPFWTMLMDDDLYRENKFESAIFHIQRILNGEEAFEYDTWVKLQKSDVSFLWEIWQRKKDGHILESDLEKLMHMKENIRCGTISDMLHIKLILMLLITDLYDYNTLYCHSIEEFDIVKNIEYLFEVLRSERPLHLSLLYNMGINNFDIVIL